MTDANFLVVSNVVRLQKKTRCCVQLNSRIFLFRDFQCTGNTVTTVR